MIWPGGTLAVADQHLVVASGGELTDYTGVPQTASAGPSSGGPSGYRYQWLLCSSSGTRCRAIRGVTTRFFTPTSQELGHQLRVRLRAWNESGASAAVASRASPIRR